MEKNIVEVVMNNKGEVIEKVADYIGVASFAKTIENLYRECLEKFDNAEDSEHANKDREYLEEWYFKAFGTYNIQYNFSNELEEIHSMMEEDYVEA